MTEEPRTAVQTAGHVADSVVTGFSGAPALLLIVILNIVMIAAAAYFLSKQEENRAATINKVTELLELCFDHAEIASPNHRIGPLPPTRQGG